MIIMIDISQSQQFLFMFPELPFAPDTHTHTQPGSQVERNGLLFDETTDVVVFFSDCPSADPT